MLACKGALPPSQDIAVRAIPHFLCASRMSLALVSRIREQIAEIHRSLAAKEVVAARNRVPGCDEEVSRLQRLVTEIEERLENVPAIEIAFLGPSRHGKSTLLNALAAQSLLPTSDTRPCTASILRLKWAADWAVTVSFVEKDELVSDWKTAVVEADDYLKRLDSKNVDGESADDPKYLLNTLQRFIQLFRLNREDDPVRLLEQVRTAKIPSEIGRLLGTRAQPTTNSFQTMKGVVAKYLSTQDVYWTIVEECEIAGPFEHWHEKLSLVDLPGTNDSNPQRAATTNSLREESQAVAIVTSDSNLGPDIESWLRNSSVLSEFLEAQASRRQRLFIIRTKLDAYHPQDDNFVDDDEAEEERRYQAAFAKYKVEQAASYHEMFREIILPKLPSGPASSAMTEKRQELLSRVREIPVHFVSAYAYEAFEGRATGTSPRNLRRLKEHFSGDPLATGIPDLRAYINQIAAEYLAVNFYEDIQSRLEREVGLLAQYFQKEASAVQAQMAGAGESVRALVVQVQNQVIPWIGSEVNQRTTEFQRQATAGGNEVRQRLDQVWAMSSRRLADKQDKWKLYHWNSLRSTARKGGSHTTWRGDHIDINEDICDVLVGDVILAWTSYRDYLIQKHISELTDEFSQRLQVRMREAARQTADPDAQQAIAQIVEQLGTMTLAQRDDLLRKVDSKVRQLESIRGPSKQYIQDAMAPTFASIKMQGGTGCQLR